MRNILSRKNRCAAADLLPLTFEKRTFIPLKVANLSNKFLVKIGAVFSFLFLPPLLWANQQHLPPQLVKMTPLEKACESPPDQEIQGLCEIVLKKFGAQQDSYLPLGQGFFLVAASNTGRISQGIYVANVNTKAIQQFGGYGLPKIKKITQLGTDHFQIYLSTSSLSHGNLNSAQQIITVKKNPVTETPYLTQQIFKESKRKPSLIASHQKALKSYHDAKSLGGTSAAYQILEDAGIFEILFEKPSNISVKKYIQILNDYAFFAYPYGDGHVEIAVDVLNRVIHLDPARKPAYLNMAEALKQMAEYPSVPLTQEQIKTIRAKSEGYLKKYQSMKTVSNEKV
jgi:hypothetical protein